jgi:3-mercaptopyruvate sulfurtransferase SseA
MNQSQQSLYDGSWAEWGVEQLYPGEESLAERPVRTSLED